MVKKKLTPVVLLCCLLIGLNACSRYVVAGAVAAGAAAGTYFFVKGNLKRSYEAPVKKVWEATLQAVEELRLATESKRYDAFGGEIKGMMADPEAGSVDNPDLDRLVDILVPPSSKPIGGTDQDATNP